MGVKLEVFRMMLYLSFPVAMFWYTNRPDYFEEHVVQKRLLMIPPDQGLKRKQWEDFKDQTRLRNEKRMLKDTSMETASVETGN